MVQFIDIILNVTKNITKYVPKYVRDTSRAQSLNSESLKASGADGTSRAFVREFCSGAQRRSTGSVAQQVQGRWIMSSSFGATL